MSNLPSPAPSRKERWLYWGSWIIAIGALATAAYLGWKVRIAQAIVPEKTADPQPVAEKNASLTLPALQQDWSMAAVTRRIELHTVVPARSRTNIINYTVQSGDSVFAIAQSFGLKPESILWANYEMLNDNPDQLSPGMELNIPPVDGVLYTWKEGDSLQGVAERFKAKLDEMLGWSGNNLDLTNPVIESGSLVMVPGGQSEFKQWLVPTIPRGAAGVSRNLYGAGACPGGYDGAYGTGAFVWPADNHYLSGNDYWSGHLGIDLAAGMGAAIYAADSGVVVFSGSAFGGYGYMVMLDHGNGYQTLYSHMSSISAGCGASVYQGQYIGAAGNSGKSTGPHLHFEVRYLGGFVNPWFVLPAP